MTPQVHLPASEAQQLACLHQRWPGTAGGAQAARGLQGAAAGATAPELAVGHVQGQVVWLGGGSVKSGGHSHREAIAICCVLGR